MDIILFGPPGAGKGTQAAAVSQAASVPHVSTGDIFRFHLKGGTDLGARVKAYMAAGQLVPDELVMEVVASRLEQADAAGGVLFDGFPRTVNQAQLLRNWLVENGRDVDVVVNLVVPDQVVEARLSGRRSCLDCGSTFHVEHRPPAAGGLCTKCGAQVVQREDDRPATVKSRIETYHAQTAPVLAWAKGEVRVVDVDANRAIEDVRGAVLAALG